MTRTSCRRACLTTHGITRLSSMTAISERAGYTVSLFAVDVSPSMGQVVEDSETGQSRTKLDWAREYVARKMDRKIMSGRKTEHVGLLTFGTEGTINEANQNWLEANPDDEDDQPYTNIECNVAIQTAKPTMLEVLMNTEVGPAEGNPVSALVVALDMIRVHKSSKSWFQEIYLITDGESAFEQYEYEEVIERIRDLGIKLFIIGAGFQEPDQPVDKGKTQQKRLSEKFWRAFSAKLVEEFGPDFPECHPLLGTLSHALHVARLPHPQTTSSTLGTTILTIGSADIEEQEAISIGVRYSKATSKAKAPSTKKAWKPALAQQPAPRLKPQYYQNAQAGSQSESQPQAASQSQRKPTDSQMAGVMPFSGSQASKTFTTGSLPPAREVVAPQDRYSTEVKGYTKYVILRPTDETEPEVSQVPANGPSTMTIIDNILSRKAGLEDEEDDDEEFEVKKPQKVETVEKEDLVKAYRFGSTWLPMEDGLFEPMETKKGLEVLNFFPVENVERHLLIGEVQFIWPEQDNPRSQIQFSSFVQALKLKKYCALTRWVLKDGSAPRIGICFPEIDDTEPDKPLEFMFWVQMPFAEDEHNFFFASLTKIKTTKGKILTEHPLLPTEDQCHLMANLVSEMDLEHVPGETGELEPWFDIKSSFNPVIHRINEAIFHNAISIDLEADPTPPPHPAIVKYFETPEEVVEKVEGPLSKLKDSLDIKIVPPKPTRKTEKSGVRPDEGYIDVDALLGSKGESSSQKPPRSQPSTPRKPAFPTDKPHAPKEILSDDEDAKPDIPGDIKEDEIMEDSEEAGGMSRPKDGRIISNESPLEDFERVTSAEGDILLRKAIQDLGEVVKENIAASFSTSAFPLALECLEKMKDIAKKFEEVETYNDFVESFEIYIKDKTFKHKDFWKHFEKAGIKVSAISSEEARLALEEDMEDDE